MRRLANALAVAAALSFAATPALAAAPCKDAKGKFVKCPQVAKGKDGKCRYTSGPMKGKFAKCGA